MLKALVSPDWPHQAVQHPFVASRPAALHWFTTPVGISHPLVQLLSQFSYGATQAREQEPVLQLAVAWAPAVHGMPQPPQSLVELSGVSQPVPCRSKSQSPQPLTH